MNTKENAKEKDGDTIVRQAAQNETDHRAISLLIRIHRTLGESRDLRDAFESTLRILKDAHDILSCAVFLIDETDRKLVPAVAIGYPTQNEEIAYALGEGLTGKVARSGRPVVVPRVSHEPMFLNRMHAWDPEKDRDQTFIGIPISASQKVYGVLIVHLPYQPDRDYKGILTQLTAVASALYHPVRMHRSLENERQRLLDENVMLKQKLQEEYSFHNIIGNSHAMRDVYEHVARVCRSQTTVLIRGESGTGKELIAEAIHYNSLRKDGPFIRVSCAAIPETLIESEFFGHEKGAFTGALIRKPGRFELADGGTIFLDEVGELTPMTQVKLLRVLQEQRIERVGGTETLKVDVRIIAATNAQLEILMEEGKFREDLYYRLNVFSIYLPPLRDRKTDILLLADHFLQRYGRQHAKAIKRISTPAIDMLMRYHWPGNVRELENCIERAVLLCEDQVIHSYNLPPSLQTAESSDTIPARSLQDSVASYERELIQDALKSTRGNKAKAARLLSTTERIIGYKIKNYGIDLSRFKS